MVSSVCVFVTQPFKSAVAYVSEGHTRRIRHRDSDVVDSRMYKVIVLILLYVSVPEGNGFSPLENQSIP